MAASAYIVLPRDGLDPWDDPNCRFDSAGGFIIGPNVDAGVPTFQKWLNGARTLTESSTGARSTAVAYDLDNLDSFTTLMTAVDSGITEEKVETEISFYRIRYKMTLATGDDEHTPRVVALMFNTTPNPPRYRLWRMMLDVGDQQKRRGGGDPRPVAYEQALNHLFAATGERVTFTDYFGDEFTSKLMNVAVQGLSGVARSDSRSAVKSAVEIVIAEISQNETVGLPGIWDQSVYDSGVEYS